MAHKNYTMMVSDTDIPLYQFKKLRLQFFIPQSFNPLRNSFNWVYRNLYLGMQISNGYPCFINCRGVISFHILVPKLVTFLLICNSNLFSRLFAKVTKTKRSVSHYYSKSKNIIINLMSFIVFTCQCFFKKIKTERIF